MLVNEDFQGHNDVLDAVITSDENLGVQVRMTISEFMGRHYFGIRKYYLDFEGEWKPTKLGMSWPYDLETTTNMWGAFTEILSEAEVLAAVAAEHEKLKGANDVSESGEERDDPSVPSGAEG